MGFILLRVFILLHPYLRSGWSMKLHRKLQHPPRIDSFLNKHRLGCEKILKVCFSPLLGCEFGHSAHRPATGEFCGAVHKCPSNGVFIVFIAWCICLFVCPLAILCWLEPPMTSLPPPAVLPRRTPSSANPDRRASPKRSRARAGRIHYPSADCAHSIQVGRQWQDGLVDNTGRGSVDQNTDGMKLKLPVCVRHGHVSNARIKLRKFQK